MTLLPLAALVAGAVWLGTPEGAFVNSQVWKTRANRIPRAADDFEVESAKDSITWQKRLSAALLDLDTPLEERLNDLASVITSPTEIADSIGAALKVVSEKGVLEGQADALEALLPKGTLARSDLEGLLALARQAPEALRSLRIPTKLRTNETDPPSGLVKWILPKDLEGASYELGNIFRRTPKGREEPGFVVVSTADEYEIRCYESYSVAQLTTPREVNEGLATVQGFNTLANYIFGDNEDGKKMGLSMPVEISYDKDDKEVRTLSFVIPSEDTDNEGYAPEPVDRKVRLAQVPQRLVAIREFPGIATDAEAARQLQILTEALEDSGYTPVFPRKYSVLQYNPLYTLPWRRRNEVAVVVMPSPVKRNNILDATRTDDFDI